MLQIMKQKKQQHQWRVQYQYLHPQVLHDKKEMEREMVMVRRGKNLIVKEGIISMMTAVVEEIILVRITVVEIEIGVTKMIVGVEIIMMIHHHLGGIIVEVGMMIIISTGGEKNWMSLDVASEEVGPTTILTILRHPQKKLIRNQKLKKRRKLMRIVVVDGLDLAPCHTRGLDRCLLDHTLARGAIHPPCPAAAVDQTAVVVKVLIEAADPTPRHDHVLDQFHIHQNALRNEKRGSIIDIVEEVTAGVRKVILIREIVEDVIANMMAKKKAEEIVGEMVEAVEGSGAVAALMEVGDAGGGMMVGAVRNGEGQR